MNAASTQPVAQIGNTAWYLVKILHIEGSCDHCGRNLKHLYQVVNPDGVEMTVGRGCVKRITGWTLSYAQAQQALRCVGRGAEIDRRREIIGAEYPELATADQAVQAACRRARLDGFDPLSGYHRVPLAVRSQAAVFTTALTADHLWRGEQWRQYLQRSI